MPNPTIVIDAHDPVVALADRFARGMKRNRYTEPDTTDETLWRIHYEGKLGEVGFCMAMGLDPIEHVRFRNTGAANSRDFLTDLGVPLNGRHCRIDVKTTSNQRAKCLIIPRRKTYYLDPSRSDLPQILAVTVLSRMGPVFSFAMKGWISTREFQRRHFKYESGVGRSDVDGIDNDASALYEGTPYMRFDQLLPFWKLQAAQ